MHSAVFSDLKGRSVFISGGASGIGEALVAGFVAQGAKVAFADIVDGSALADRLGAEHNNRPLALKADVTDIPALQRAIATAAKTHGPITVLVNNAARDDRHKTLEVTPDYWRGNLAVNLDHVFFAAQAVIPGMKAAGGGSIINFSSISYMLGMGGMPAYTAAKAAITALTRTLAREWGADGIRVNGIAPGWVMTERQMKLWATPDTMESILKTQALKTHIQPADLIGPVLFLASDASRMIAGQTLAVDGGWVTVPA
jgi:galactose dehydrogenase